MLVNCIFILAIESKLRKWNGTCSTTYKAFFIDGFESALCDYYVHKTTNNYKTTSSKWYYKI